MDERTVPSKRGFPTAYAGANALHSSYDPVREAERYIESLAPNNDTRYFILIEPALAYTISVLRKLFPGAFIIALRCSPFFRGQGNPDAEWVIGDSQNLQSFLEKKLPDAGISLARVIEWRPSLDAYGGAYLSILQDLAVFLKRGSANTATVKAFGPRWIKNCLRNAAFIEKVLTFKPGNCPVLVCAAGPGLEKSMDRIRGFSGNGNVFIIAVSSAVLALRERGIAPDLVIGSDGGNWARLHCYESMRVPGEKTVCAATLNAALPSQCYGGPLLLISDGSAWQSVLLRELLIPHMQFPQRGTVSAAALDLALEISSGEIYLCGADLRQYDLLAHARPYAFDTLISGRANRFFPAYSQTYSRIRQHENPSALSIYADWFRNYLGTNPGRIFSLGKNHSVFPEKAMYCKTGNTQMPQFTVIPVIKKPGFPLEILLGAMGKNDAIASAIKNELGELLQAGGATDADDAAGKKLAALAGGRHHDG